MNHDINMMLVVSIFKTGNEEEISTLKSLLQTKDLLEVIGKYESSLQQKKFNLQREFAAATRQLEQASEKHVQRLKEEYGLEVKLEELRKFLQDRINLLSGQLESVQAEVCWLYTENIPKYTKPVKLQAKQVASVF